jgi:hypothetical protein
MTYTQGAFEQHITRSMANNNKIDMASWKAKSLGTRASVEESHEGNCNIRETTKSDIEI